MVAERVEEVLAIVPARGGSKGVPGKNIRSLAGHPLIAWSIAAGLQSPSISRVIVSTDDEAIADVARAYGADVPFIRPLELAQDLSRDLEVFAHALDWLEQNEGYTPELVVQLRPTTPIRFVSDIEAAIGLMRASPNATSLRTLAEPPHTPYKMWRMPAEGDTFIRPLLMVDGFAEPYNEPRQNLPKAYWHTGTLDIIRRKTIRDGSMSGRGILPYLLPADQCVDIDDLAAFAEAEQVLKRLQLAVRP